MIVSQLCCLTPKYRLRVHAAVEEENLVILF